MADYNKATNFTAKDTLPTGNASKIVKGAEIDTELTAVASAIASKANINSPGLTGTPTAPTASAGTNTTQLATTAFVTAALSTLSAAYPVGSIYINASVSTNPATLLGFGTWEAFGAGRVLVGFNASDALFDTLEETGGSKDAVVVSHTHTATLTDPGHFHTTGITDNEVLGSSVATGASVSARAPNLNAATTQNSFITSSQTTGISVTNTTAGVSGTNANIQPYITVRMWKRTA
jgi:hypothetical protein